MRRALLRLLFVLLPTAVACDDGGKLGTPTSTSSSGSTSGQSANPTTVRFAAFNVLRLFDTTCESGNCASGQFEDLPSPTAFENKVARIAKGIADLDADVVALAEVETAKGLDALRAKLPQYTVAVHGETGTAGSLDTALLAKGRLVETRTHESTPIAMRNGTMTRFSRELLEVHLTIEDKSVVAFAAHFRSKVNDDPERRIAEAIATRTIVDATAKEKPDALVLLGGDLNDVPGSEAINSLERGDRLFRVAKDLSPAEQATYVYQGTPEAIDHIFVAAGVQRWYVPGSAAVAREGASGYAGSDHSAIRADFTIPPP